ncbi:MAG: sigma-54-dependent Fis family transcriptional regulator [Saprospiraceae bacterium]|nr:sigma-54-dependent Fis family transcriptional regulator [Saprospiraceae bacterium]
MNLTSVKQRFAIIGRSEKLDRALSTAVRVASTDLSVLIQGESGVGKEIFSRIIHELSKRKHNKFIAINCGAIPAGTINSELFGHEKGAFTGATSDRKGYFETVDGGTIFLDEIGEMPLDTQAYLLRILESGEFIKVGSSKVLKTDVRIVAATNIDLEKKIKKGKFREDLYYRLNTVPIFVPSLKERREDIYMLFRKFAVDFADKYRTDAIQLDPRSRQLIENYSWPGNVRELRNIVEQLSVLSEEKLITAESLIDLVPNIVKRNLPAIADQMEDKNGFQERELLFKFLLDMKTDLNDLKSLIFEMIRTNDLEVPDMSSLKPMSPVPSDFPTYERSTTSYPSRESEIKKEDYHGPIIIESPHDRMYQQSEEVEENLSIEDMEKDLIKKALKKYKGRRKDAARELGISERTLYRKIKQYDIPD